MAAEPMSPSQFLETLLMTPSVSGYEEPAQRVVRSYAAPWADRVETDVHGNVFATVNPEGRPRVMLAGHCDQIGMIVTYIDDRGYVWPQTVGGWEAQQLLGQRMTIWTKAGPVPAVLSRKPIHLLEPEETNKAVQMKDLWLDLGVQDGAEARSLVAIGDPVTLDLRVTNLQGRCISAPGLDNTAGLWVCIEAARRAREKVGTGQLDAAIVAVSTVQEEVGLRGAKTAAYRADPDLAIAVDVTHASDCPTIDPKQRGDVKLGAGPVLSRGINVNGKLFDRLTGLAREHEIPYQVAALNKPASNDGNVLQINRAGVATAVMGIPNRYMHSACEVCHRDDLEAAANLLAALLVSLKADDDFRPE